MEINLIKDFIFNPYGRNIVVIDYSRNNLLVNVELMDLYKNEIITLINERFLNHYQLIFLTSQEIDKIKSNNFNKHLKYYDAVTQQEIKFINQIFKPPFNYNYLWSEFSFSTRSGLNRYKNLKIEFIPKVGFKIKNQFSYSFHKTIKENKIYYSGIDLKYFLMEIK